MGNSNKKLRKGKEKNRVCLDDFVLMKTVGRGSFGKVVMVKLKETGDIFAMKVLKKEMVIQRKQYEHTLSERRILSNISHPFIVSLRFAFQTDHKLYMVFDFFNGGEIYHYLSRLGCFPEDRSRFYAAQIVCALDYLHKQNIVYRDLKPENLILDSSGYLRVTDFGLSKDNVQGNGVTSICGTPEYLAPEILLRKPHGKEVDWWSLGTFLYEMLTGLPPFFHKHRQKMYRRILQEEFRPASHVSPQAADLCSKMLTRDPKKRLGSNGAEEIMKHHFFSPIDWKKLLAMELEPPFSPQVKNNADVSNISEDFTNEPAAITATPVQSPLAEATEEDGSFTDFSFCHRSLLDDKIYRVSFSEDDENMSDSQELNAI
eukprot:TRINITY_DN907_c0_g2_i1.p1 TRINITY_DN907_c0_g2~~TRINITY_DN907_c0_g2_i1.p1  ORF type:complete len:401 (+),score=59.56 TRINITY_DN907_c0_g2_i1:85-1203(+)